MTSVTTFLALAGVSLIGALALILARCRGLLKTEWLPLMAWILFLLAVAAVLLNLARDASAAV